LELLEAREMKTHALIMDTIRAIPVDPDTFRVLDLTGGLLVEDGSVAV